MFGYGHHPDARKLYRDKLRTSLPAWSRAYWDKWIKFFHTPGKSFYYRGTSGSFARMICQQQRGRNHQYNDAGMQRDQLRSRACR